MRGEIGGTAQGELASIYSRIGLLTDVASQNFANLSLLRDRVVGSIPASPTTGKDTLPSPSHEVAQISAGLDVLEAVIRRFGEPIADLQRL